MENKVFNLLIENSEGILELEVSQTVMNKYDDNMSVTLSTTIQGEAKSWESETTEDTLILLAKSLPEGWKLKSCFSCRFGNFCPVGDYDNELFCVTDFEPKESCDLWHVNEDAVERKNRRRTLFDCCECYKEQAENYYTYSDYYHIMHPKRTEE